MKNFALEAEAKRSQEGAQRVVLRRLDALGDAIRQRDQIGMEFNHDQLRSAIERLFGIRDRESDRQWKGCQLINPLCPDDLCTLDPGSMAHTTGQHRLETWIEPGLVADCMVVLQGSHDKETLIRKGVELAERLEAEGKLA